MLPYDDHTTCSSVGAVLVALQLFVLFSRCVYMLLKQMSHWDFVVTLGSRAEPTEHGIGCLWVVHAAFPVFGCIVAF